MNKTKVLAMAVFVLAIPTGYPDLDVVRLTALTIVAFLLIKSIPNKDDAP